MPERPAPPGRFARFELRTTDPDAARPFYAEILGGPFDPREVEIVALPAQARARGAPAHWLGHVAVADVAGAVDAMLAAGATRLGPPVPPAARTRVVLRDPFGAVLAVAPAALATGPDAPDAVGASPSPVVWHALAVEDAEAALALYAATFGWAPTGPFEAAGSSTRQAMFSWDAGAKGVGSISDHARLTGVHPHWLFLFAVSDVERSAATVRALGGTVLPAVRSPAGELAVMCEDPQGAAFGLLEPETGGS